MAGQKRRRSQAFTKENKNGMAEASLNGQNKDGDEESRNARAEKEREVWDSFREEFYEAIEQLPLSIHRQYTLMRELDEQAQGYNAALLPALRTYIVLRESMSEQHGAMTRNASNPEQPLHVPPNDAEIVISDKNHIPAALETPVRDLSVPTQVEMTGDAIPTPPTSTTFLSPARPKSPRTTRAMLSYMAWLSEEILRASEEKVNLAQAAYDSVDRHVRLIDQAIKEQEAAISIGIRPGTHPAPIVLPELQVPRWSRPTRTVYSPTVDEPLNHERQEDGVTTLGIVAETPADIRTGPRKGKKGKSKATPKKPIEAAPTVPPVDIDTGKRRQTRSLKLNVPLSHSTATTDEERYCYCDGVSFGTMVACDGVRCEKEWFHLACAGLNDVPKGRWYCRACQRKK